MMERLQEFTSHKTLSTVQYTMHGKENLENSIPKISQKATSEVYSDYLLSETPAYSVIGGVYDILEASNGQTYIVEESDAIDAGNILETVEGIDVLSPAKVALASLIQAKESGDVSEDDCILLNVSGGGVERLKSEKETEIVKPWIADIKENLVEKVLKSLN